MHLYMLYAYITVTCSYNLWTQFIAVGLASIDHALETTGGSTNFKNVLGYL